MGRSAANEKLRENKLVWLIEDSNKSGLFGLGQVTETIGVFNGFSINKSSQKMLEFAEDQL